MDTGSSGAIVDDHAPLWKYVNVQEKVDKAGGNARWKCNFCFKDYNGSHYRVKAHLLKQKCARIQVCAKVTPRQLSEMQKVVDEASERLKNLKSREVPLPTSSSMASGSTRSLASVESRLRQDPFEQLKKRKAKSDNPIEKAFNLAAREEVHSEIARLFYSSALSFNVAKNPHYVRSYTLAANGNTSGYILPGYNLLRTTLLEKERANLEDLLQPKRSSWKQKGVSIVSDGWSDPQRRPLLNFMAVNEGGPMFLKAVNCEGEYKDKHYIANLIKDVILEVGPSNVVQVITDNAPVCKSAGLLIEAQFPSIFWVPCVVHTLNLALKNICAAKNTLGNEETYDECNWISDIVGDAMFVKNFIMNHNMRLSIFNEHVDLKMLSIAETRFASSIVMLKRFKVLKRGLQSMVISDRWASYKEDDVTKAAFVREKILDEFWWDKIDYILCFTDPIYSMIRRADTDEPCLHLVYEMWDTMIEKVRIAIFRHEGQRDDEHSSFYLVVHTILVSRWEKSNTPLHCLAHSLNPRYYSTEWLEEVPGRVPPHQDAEISSERDKCFKRYFLNNEERRQANTEFAKFSACFQEFSDCDSVRDRGHMEPSYWWVVHGSSIPLVQKIALKLLGQPSSSSCCERNWSTYSLIHSLKRNKLTPQRAKDLVFVHSNLRLLSRRSPQYKEGETRMWDIGGDAFDSLEGSGILEVANLSLDEPELEAIMFTDGDDRLDDNEELREVGPN